MKIDNVTVTKSKGKTGYYCAESGEEILMGDTVGWYDSKGEYRKRKVEIDEEGKIIPLEWYYDGCDIYYLREISKKPYKDGIHL